MKRLKKPEDTMEISFNACFEGMDTRRARELFEPCLPELIRLEDEYNELGRSSNFHLVDQPVKSSFDNPIIIEKAEKNDFINLYTYYFVKKTPGRRVYNRIKLIGNKRCAFCGGIGHVKNLDHFLPKAFYPQLSILPTNLVPTCLDCNLDAKGSSFSLLEDQQVIHPYLDDDCFFDEQWIKAELRVSDYLYLDFHAEPPDHWTEVAKARAIYHFETFGLSEKYRLQAGSVLTDIKAARKTSQQRCWTPETYSEHLLELAQNLSYPNDCRKIVCQTLSTSDWFCAYDFFNSDEFQD